MDIVAEPLTPERFAPFGEVVAHRGQAARFPIPLANDHAPPAATPVLWVGRYAGATGTRVEHAKLERHPHSAQLFLPLAVERYVVVLAPDGPGGMPRLSGIRAFVAGPGLGVCYRRGVWHAPMTALGAAAQFASSMWSAGGPDRDDEWFDLPEVLSVSIG